jgi:hypothetical protein
MRVSLVDHLPTLVRFDVLYTSKVTNVVVPRA